MTLTDGTDFSLTPEEARARATSPGPEPAPPFIPNAHTLRDGTRLTNLCWIAAPQLYEVQQYCMSESGYPPLVRWLEGHMVREYRQHYLCLCSSIDHWRKWGDLLLLLISACIASHPGCPGPAGRDTLAPLCAPRAHHLRKQQRRAGWPEPPPAPPLSTLAPCRSPTNRPSLPPGTDLVLRCILQRGDVAIVEEYTYSAALQAMRPIGVSFVSVPADASGPLPDALRARLMERRARGATMPKLMYAVPVRRPLPSSPFLSVVISPADSASGKQGVLQRAARTAALSPGPSSQVSCNPTGVSWSQERKEAIYALACEFDFLILEDDAYFYLQARLRPSFAPSPVASLVPSRSPQPCSRPGPQFPEPGAPPPGISGLGHSLLSMDVASRVVRIDTFSKFVAPGLRLGWVSSPPLLHEKLVRPPHPEVLPSVHLVYGFRLVLTLA